MKNSRLLLLALLPLSACVRTPAQEKKSPHHVLSGEHYSSMSVAGVPILKAKEKDTVVRGKVTVEDPLAVLPGDLQVQLWRESALVSETRASRAGEFELVGNFADGMYLVKIASRRLEGEGELKISGFRVEDLILTARLKKKPD